MHDVLIIGGGAIGLSIAYELARRGRRVHVVERGKLGQESSWAGAGIVPPGRFDPRDPPLLQLAGLSAQMHPELAERLRSETGIDTGFRVTGATYLAPTRDALARLEDEVEPFRSQQLRCESLTPAALAQVEPALAGGFDDGRLAAAYHLPQEAQLRNPRHVRALIEAGRKLGVAFTEDAPVEEFLLAGDRLSGVRTAAGTLSAERYCLAGGAWSAALGEQLGVRLRVKPIRGQIALLRPDAPLVRGIVYAGRKYFVARDDGRILVGSTEEDVGFDKRTTAAVIRELLDFAVGLVPALGEAAVERTWAGLRPHSADDLPYLGRLPHLANAFVAAGHYRWGLALSPATALVMSQLLLDEPTAVDLTAFRVGR